MKWNEEDKKRLFRILVEKFRALGLVEKSKYSSIEEEWHGFCRTFGMVTVERQTDRYGRWLQEGSRHNTYDTPAFSRKHIIVLDPGRLSALWLLGCNPDTAFSSKGTQSSGLKIPRDVAFKILALGLP